MALFSQVPGDGVPSAHARPPGLGRLGDESYIAEPYAILDRSRVHVGTCVVIEERCRLEVGHRCERLGSSGWELAEESDAVLWIGDGARISVDFIVRCPGSVAIGERVRIGPSVFIGDMSPHCGLRGDSESVASTGSVRIGDDATIGARACVLGGVMVGERAVIAPGAVVLRDVPSGSVAAGNPARVRPLDDAET